MNHLIQIQNLIRKTSIDASCKLKWQMTFRSLHFWRLKGGSEKFAACSLKLQMDPVQFHSVSAMFRRTGSWVPWLFWPNVPSWWRKWWWLARCVKKEPIRCACVKTARGPPCWWTTCCRATTAATSSSLRWRVQLQTLNSVLMEQAEVTMSPTMDLSPTWAGW